MSGTTVQYILSPIHVIFHTSYGSGKPVRTISNFHAGDKNVKALESEIKLASQQVIDLINQK